jgi:autotransporter translocation and assembly factor TamB
VAHIGEELVKALHQQGLTHRQRSADAGGPKAGDQQLEITQLQARSGGASAELTARLQKAGPGDWQLQSVGSLIDFDPLPWWPGESGSTWRQGPHRLSAGWQFDLRLPGNAAGLATIELAQRVAGSGVLRSVHTPRWLMVSSRVSSAVCRCALRNTGPSMSRTV